MFTIKTNAANDRQDATGAISDAPIEVISRINITNPNPFNNHGTVGR